jgi:hypothetical protein
MNLQFNTFNTEKTPEFFNELLNVKGEDSSFFKKLYSYMFNFFGYGNLLGKYWFVGIEEGGGYNCIDELKKGINIWHTQKIDCDGTTLDAYEYQKEYFGEDSKDFQKLFGLNNVSQRTWKQLINIILSYKNENNDISKYQREKLGRLDGENCILNLFPLSCININSWNYCCLCPGLKCLKNRKEYEDNIKKYRINKLKKLINDYKPELIVFYYKNIINEFYADLEEKYNNNFQNLSSSKKYNISLKMINGTKLAAICHPRSVMGEKEEYFKTVGRLLKNNKIFIN